MPDLAVLTLTTEHTLTPEQVADAFWQLNDEAQAAFFVRLGTVSQNAGPGALGMQACSFTELLRLHPNPAGMDALRTLSDFAYKFGHLGQPAEAWML